jgi:protoporphyrinogen oxidase
MSMSGFMILGGGVAGIAASYTARTHGVEAVVYEAGNRAGGLLDCFQIGGYRFDHAVHLSFTKNKTVRELFDQVPYITHHPVPVNYEEGRWLKHPVQNNLFPLPVGERIEAIESFVNRPDNGEAANYRDWLLHQYGRYIAERFPIRYTRKYWTVPAESLTTDWIGNRMYRPALSEVLQGAMSADTPNTYYAEEMRYPQKGGYRTFLEPMLANADVRCGMRAVRIDPRRKSVEFADGTVRHYEFLISSLPLPVLIEMMEGAPTSVRDAASGLWATSVALVSMGFTRPDAAKHLWFYIYDEKIMAARAYSPSLKSPDNAPAGCSSLQFEVYYSRNRPLQMQPDHLAEHITDAVVKIGIAERSDIAFVDTRTIPFGNVAFDHGMHERRETIRAYLRTQGILSVGRFGEWDYLWSDQSLMSGRRAILTLLLQGRP